MNLDDHLAEARARFVARHPESAAFHQRASDVMPGGNTRSVLHHDPFPIRIVGAQGRTVTDLEGHTYVDLLGNYTAGLFGHSPAPILSAVRAAIDRGVTLGGTHRDEVLLAESIVGRFPGIERVRFTNSGTEANLMALALATHVTGRTGVVVFDGGYHGGVLTFGGHGREVDVPHRWIVLPYNDTGAVVEAFATDDDIAAVLVEPMQGAGGGIPADVEFLRVLRAETGRRGAVLIVDEVMTSRLAPGGLQASTGVIGDVTTLGKYLAGGMSFGAFGGRAGLMAAFDTEGPLGHAGTFNNNVLSMAAGVAAAEYLTDDRLVEVNARGDRLRAGLNEVLGSIGMCATGVGSILGVHPVPGPVTSAADLAGGDERLREAWYFASMEAGFHVARRGFLALSLEVTDEDVDRYVDAIATWSEVLAGRVGGG